ncbi:MAG: hypothetical protein JNK02_05540 [Planctomycetes bacterium]|nr:hypothetical protein [Planctomycetota bacterium]
MQHRLLLVPLLAALPCSCTTSGSSAEQAAGSRAAETTVVQAAADPAALAFDAAGTAEPGSLPLQEGVGADAQRAARLRQQQQFLAGQFLEEGNRLLERGDLEGALTAFANALDLDTSSQAARTQLRKVEALLGDRYQTAGSFLEDAAQREVVRRSQARMAAEDARIRAKNALAQGDYATAVEQYRQAEIILRYNPLIATDSLDAKLVRGELETAVRLSEEGRAEEARLAATQAEETKRRAEEAARQSHQDRQNELFASARTAFLNEDYERAESITTQILLEDPNNAAAKDLRGIAQEMRHAKADETIRRDYREQWIRTFEELDTMDVPQISTLEFDDLKRWRVVSQRKPLEFSPLDLSVAQDKQAVLDILDQRVFEPKFLGPDGDGSALEEVASFLQTVTGVNFLISPKVTQDLDEEQRTIKLDLPARSVRKVLDLIAEISESLRWKVENGVVMFVTKDELKGGQVLRMYGVQDLIRPVPDFPGREMNVSPSGGAQLEEEELTEREANVITGDALDTLIRNNVAPASWEADPQNSLRISGGTMVVNQTPEVHAQIERLLRDLREATGILVDIQARFLSVEDNFLEDIGVDFRGLGQPGLGSNDFFNDFGNASTQQDLGREIGQGTDSGAFYDKASNQQMRARVEELYDTALGDENVLTGSGGLSFQWTYLNDIQLEMILRAVSKSERVELVTSPRISVHNTARGNLSVVNHVAYVQDFNVEIAQAASIADPIVNVVQDGVVLDVRPVISADRRFITLELRPTIATLKRPIREVVTTLGSQNSVTIQLPEVEYQRVRTSIPMPDGGTVLLGGLKISDKQDLASGVPILNKIPLVSFFFNRQGKYVSNRKLLILLKANIVIPQESEPTPVQIAPPKVGQ